MFCLCVCVYVQNTSESYELILMKFLSKNANMIGIDQVTFGEDLDSDSFVHPGSFSSILYR